MNKDEKIVYFKLEAPNFVSENCLIEQSFEKIMLQSEADKDRTYWEKVGVVSVTDVTDANRDLAIKLLKEECDLLEGSMKQFELCGRHNDAVSYVNVIKEKEALLERIAN